MTGTSFVIIPTFGAFLKFIMVLHGSFSVGALGSNLSGQESNYIRFRGQCAKPDTRIREGVIF